MRNIDELKTMSWQDMGITSIEQVFGNQDVVQNLDIPCSDFRGDLERPMLVMYLSENHGQGKDITDFTAFLLKNTGIKDINALGSAVAAKKSRFPLLYDYYNREYSRTHMGRALSENNAAGDVLDIGVCNYLAHIGYNVDTDDLADFISDMREQLFSADEVVEEFEEPVEEFEEPAEEFEEPVEDYEESFEEPAEEFEEPIEEPAEDYEDISDINEEQGTTDDMPESVSEAEPTSVVNTNEDVKVPKIFQTAADDCRKALDILYKRAIISVKTGLIATVGGKYTCLYIDTQGIIQQTSTNTAICLLQGLTLYANTLLVSDQSVVIERADELVGLDIKTKDISSLFVAGKRSNILGHLCFMFGWYYNVDTKMWEHSSSYNKAMKKSLDVALAYYWSSVSQSDDNAKNEARTNCQSCALLLDCSSAIHSWLIVDRPKAHNNKSVYNAIYNLSKSTDESVMMNTFASSKSSFKMLTEAEEDIIVNDDALGYTFAYTPNDAGYQAQVLFGYMAVDRRAQANVLPSLKNVLLGRTLAGKDVTLDLTAQTSRFMYVNAASRSGKGVMTLSILGTAIACGVPFVYIDGKPDMAVIFWELEKNNPGSRILALDILAAARDVSKQGLGSNAKLTPGWDLHEEPQRIHNAKARSLSCSAYDSVKDKNGVPLGVKLTTELKYKLIQLVLIHKVMILKDGITKWCAAHSTMGDTKRAIFVLDEINNVTMETTGENVISCSVSDFATLPMKLSVSTKKNKSAEELAEEEEQKAQIASLTNYVNTWRHLLSYIGFALPTPLTTGNTVWGDATTLPYARAANGLQNAETAETYVNTLAIGQDTGVFGEDKAVPKFVGTHKGSTIVHESAYKPVFEKDANYSTLIRGRGANKNLFNVSGDIAYVNGRKSETRGYFNIQTGCAYSSASNQINVIKSYLTLNANDIDLPKPEFCSTFLQDAVRASYGDDAESILHNPAIGFTGYMQHLYKVAYGQDLSMADLAKQCSAGYDMAEALLTSLGILGQGNPFEYTTVEDWLYDINPDSLVEIDEFSNASESGRQIDFQEIHARWAGSAQTSSTESQGASTNANTEFIWGEGENQSSIVPPPQGIIPPEQNIVSPPQGIIPPEQGIIPPEQGIIPPEQVITPPAQGIVSPPQGIVSPPQGIIPPEQAIAPPFQTSMPPQTVLNTAYGGAQDASDSTQYASSFSTPTRIPMSFNTGKSPSDNPIAIYAGGTGKYKGKLLRSKMTEILMKEIKKAYGGLTDIKTFEEQNGILIFNHTPFMPVLPETEIALLPSSLQPDLAACRYAKIFDWDYLTQLKGLMKIKFGSPTICEEVFWSDTGIAPRPLSVCEKKLKRKWKHLTSFFNGTAELIDFDNPDDGNLTEAEKASVQKQRKEAAEREIAERSRGHNFAVGLATVLGLDPPSADEHPFMQKLSKTRPLKAIRTGAAFTAAAAVGYGIIALANPWLILFGALTAGSYVKNRYNDYREKHGK